MGEQAYGWMDEWVPGWTDGWTDGDAYKSKLF